MPFNPTTFSSPRRPKRRRVFRCSKGCKLQSSQRRLAAKPCIAHRPGTQSMPLFGSACLKLLVAQIVVPFLGGGVWRKPKFTQFILITRIKKTILMLLYCKVFLCSASIALLPNECFDLIPCAKYLVTNSLAVFNFTVINADEDDTVFPKQIPGKIESRINHV